MGNNSVVWQSHFCMWFFSSSPTLLTGTQNTPESHAQHTPGPAWEEARRSPQRRGLALRKQNRWYLLISADINSYCKLHKRNSSRPDVQQQDPISPWKRFCWPSWRQPVCCDSERWTSLPLTRSNWVAIWGDCAMSGHCCVTVPP